MKKLLNLAIIIATPLFILSCQNDAKEDLQKPFEPVVVDLSAEMGLDKSNQTKANQYPTEIYGPDVIYLMVQNDDPETRFTPYTINLTSDNGVKGFDLRIASVSPTEIVLTTNGSHLVTITPEQDIFFSSLDKCEFDAAVSPLYKTPNGSNVYLPPGKEIYRGEKTKITPIEGGFRIAKKDYLANQNNSYELLLFRLTGSFKTKVIFFKQETELDDTPLAVTQADWDSNPNLGNAANWTVTPFMRNYYSKFWICEELRGHGDPSFKDATYILSDAPNKLVASTVTVNRGSVGDFVLENTMIAPTNPEYFPYMFNGNISESPISFVISNGAQEEAFVLDFVADIEFVQSIMPNDFKTLNVCINISELSADNKLKSTGDNKNVFFFWE